MTIDDKGNLIVSVGGKTQHFNPDFVKRALRAQKIEEEMSVSTCANYERDNHEDTSKAAVKHDSSKIRMELLPVNAMSQIAKVFTFGAKKYDDFNYMKNGGLKTSRVYGALLRHVFAWFGGETREPETGESHLAHAGCCIMILLELEKFGTNIDKPDYYDNK